MSVFINGPQFLITQPMDESTLKWKLIIGPSFKEISSVRLDEELGMTDFHNGPVIFNEISMKRRH